MAERGGDLYLGVNTKDRADDAYVSAPLLCFKDQHVFTLPLKLTSHCCDCMCI